MAARDHRKAFWPRSGFARKALNKQLLKVADEKQIYRIDHYLGKETVQNILALRFANGIFEPIWNRRYIDHVQISVAETVGVEQRGGYYDNAGALRDMVPNHIMQLISLDRHGAAGFVPGQRGARRAGQDSARHPAAECRRSAQQDGARTVWRRRD